MVSLQAQVARLVAAGVPDVAGISAAQLAQHAGALPDVPGAVLALHPGLASPSQLTGLLRRGQQAGFVVEDMTDVDAFSPIPGVVVPDLPVYLVLDPTRGDELRNTTPIEALPALASSGRTPLTLNEAISWLLAHPSVLAPGACFMTLGSRKPASAGPDSRVPAIWISRGTGRDGPAHRNAPKVGWCWAGNRHTWLGHASAAGRHPAGRGSR